MSNPNSTLYGGEAEAVADARKYTQANALPDPYRAYAAQKNAAWVREIEWQFTFTAWWAIWQPYFHMRGRGTNDLCMAREKDDGPYSPSNVYLTTHLGNLQDYRRLSQKAIERRKAAKEARESAFARMGRKLYGSKDALASQLAHNNSSESTKYACNQTEGALKFD